MINKFHNMEFVNHAEVGFCLCVLDLCQFSNWKNEPHDWTGSFPTVFIDFETNMCLEVLNGSMQFEEQAANVSSQ